jgi:asparagine synthase (glutamine-hydrolysing)
VSAILATVASPAGAPPDERTAARMLARMRGRGIEALQTYRDASALLAAGRHLWELGPAFSGLAGVSRGPLAVAADATLYYVDDLRRKLQAHGIHPAGSTPSHLVLAAYRAWGERCPEHLEGDYAFVLWDGEARRVLCARDFGGKRPLFYARAGDAFVAASTAAAVRAHPDCPGGLDLAALGAAAGGYFAVADETCHAGVRALPAGCSLSWSAGALRMLCHHAPPALGGSAVPFAAAAEELRAVLHAAADERVRGTDAASVWLSGGYDSTAVLASAHGRRASDTPLRAVSLSYPPGDPGREDETIARVAGALEVPVHWIHAYDVPLLDGAQRGAAARDEPFAHAFEHWNRALARGSAAAGTRVALDGFGGDALFHNSPVYLADLLRGGHPLRFAREVRAGPVRGPRALFRWAVQPLLPPAVLGMAAALRGGRPLHGALDPRLPPWIRPEFARRHGLEQRERAHTPAPPAGGHADRETHWQLAHAWFPRVAACLASLALEEGVELRSPLYDGRVVALAAGRPREERASLGETKRLLRAAMHGLLPDDVLAPRPHRTGVPTRWFARSLRQRHRGEIGDALTTPLLLAELGIVDPAALRRSWREYLAGAAESLGLRVFLTLQTELWLRAHAGAPAPAAPEVAPSRMNALQPSIA